MSPSAYSSLRTSAMLLAAFSAAPSAGFIKVQMTLERSTHPTHPNLPYTRFRIPRGIKGVNASPNWAYSNWGSRWLTLWTRFWLIFMTRGTTTADDSCCASLCAATEEGRGGMVHDRYARGSLSLPVRHSLSAADSISFRLEPKSPSATN